MLLIHDTGTDSRFFAEPLDRLATVASLTVVDRPGWGRSASPEDYRRTSIAEQAIAVAGAAAPALAGGGVTVLGFGLGAVVAAEIGLSHPEAIGRVVMVDPPLFGLLKEATEGVSRDAEAIRSAASEGGPQAAYELFLDGGLPTLGAGADRLGGLADRGSQAAHSFIVEVPAVPAWPLEPARLGGIGGPVEVLVTGDAPEILAAAADAFAPRVPGAIRQELVGSGPAAVVEALALA